MLLPLLHGGLEGRIRRPLVGRQRPTPGGSESNPDGTETSHTANVAAIAVAIIGGILICCAIGLYFVLRDVRVRHRNPKYLPGAWLKRKWEAWTPSSRSKGYLTSLQDRRPIQMVSSPSSSATATLGPQSRNGANSGASQDNVDRHTSVRSIMTLPAYSADARPTEKILGREGERAGVDTVVEFPETAAEEEERRDEEMEGLYQIRRARRDERTAREERRRLRREARARGDRATLEQLRSEDRLGRTNAGTSETTSEALIAEHRSREQRGRRVSSISYMDVGVARHDGSRVRADSNDSNDHRPLLDSAVAMGGASGNRPQSGVNQLPGSRFGNVSTSSLSRFMTPDVSDDEQSSVEGEVLRSPRDSAEPSASRTVPRLRLDSVDTGDSRTTADVSEQRQPAPPQYDDLSPRAGSGGEQQLSQPQQQTPLRVEPVHVTEEEAPPYESPRRTDAPMLPAFARLPSIRVAPFSPSMLNDNDEEQRGASSNRGG